MPGGECTGAIFMLLFLKASWGHRFAQFTKLSQLVYRRNVTEDLYCFLIRQAKHGVSANLKHLLSIPLSGKMSVSHLCAIIRRDF